MLEKRGSLLGANRDNIVFLPFPVFTKAFGEERSLTIVVATDDIERTKEEVRAVLRRVRRIPPGEEDDFAINTQSALVTQWKALTDSIFFVMISIASLALLVGGIGIMNIMLVSVTERTQEIGIRKAVGARRGDILLQFLIEAVVLSLLGGLIGLVCGFLLAWIISMLAHLPFGVPVWAIVIGLVFSIGVGMFFGIYPARKAADLNPVEALRYE